MKKRFTEAQIVGFCRNIQPLLDLLECTVRLARSEADALVHRRSVGPRKSTPILPEQLPAPWRMAYRLPTRQKPGWGPGL